MGDLENLRLPDKAAKLRISRKPNPFWAVYVCVRISLRCVLPEHVAVA